MLGKQRLGNRVTYGRLVIDVTRRREMVWALVPSFLLALFFLSFLLLQGPPRGAISIDGPEVPAPTAANEPFLRYADWWQTDESYLAYRPVLR